MKKVISWFIGLLSLANIKAELVSLKQENADLKQEYETTQRALQDLAEEVQAFEERIEEYQSSDEKIDEKITEWSNDNLDDRIDDYISNYDFSNIISDELRNHDYVDTDSLNDAVESAMEDIEVSDIQIKTCVQSELESDWFEAQVTQVVDDICKKFITNSETTEERDNNVIIETMLKHKIEEQVIERMEAKFGEGWDTWFEEHTRFCVKSVLGDFLTSAYEQTKQK